MGNQHSSGLSPADVANAYQEYGQIAAASPSAGQKRGRALSPNNGRTASPQLRRKTANGSFIVRDRPGAATENEKAASECVNKIVMNANTSSPVKVQRALAGRNAADDIQKPTINPNGAHANAATASPKNTSTGSTAGATVKSNVPTPIALRLAAMNNNAAGSGSPRVRPPFQAGNSNSNGNGSNGSISTAAKRVSGYAAPTTSSASRCAATATPGSVSRPRSCYNPATSANASAAAPAAVINSASANAAVVPQQQQQQQQAVAAAPVAAPVVPPIDVQRAVAQDTENSASSANNASSAAPASVPMTPSGAHRVRSDNVALAAGFVHSYYCEDSRSAERFSVCNVEKPLGKGSFAAVYRGIRMATREAVAIKVVDKRNAEKHGAFSDVTREVNVLAKLDHPNIVRLVGTGDDQTAFFVMMEFIPGQDMHSFVVGRGRLSERTARYYFAQIVDAVAHIHARGFVHRDLKLENIMLDTGLNVAKLIDFGFAEDVQHKPKCYDFPGSAPYASPQLISGIPYDGKSADVWSCGVILFAMLVGTYPFWDKEHPELKHRILSTNPDFGESNASAGARQLILGMLEKNPAKRFTIADVQKHYWTTGVEQQPQQQRIPVAGETPASVNRPTRPTPTPVVAPFRKLSFE